MLIYVRISEGLKAKVDELISRGHYPDLSAAVNVALENLLLAEEEHTSRVEEKQVGAQAEASPQGPKPVRSSATDKSKLAKASTQVVDRNSGRPAVFSWVKPPTIPDELIVPFPGDLFRPGQRVPVERWIFGQQNRVLPAKINTRLFLILLSETDSEMELFQAASAIADGAAGAFRFLNELDGRFGHGKDDLLSTGFPEPDSDKAKSRYANHFGAYENTQGNLTGMMLQWKFAGVKRAKNKTYLFPTRACVDFAVLPNPLLDQSVTEKPAQKFSPREIVWLTEHIAKQVPVEASAYRTILSGLCEGCVTPDALDSFVRKHAKGKDDVTDAFVSTQRSGAVSRMADLNLIRRQRDGTKVSYEMTELGTKWLEENRSALQ